MADEDPIDDEESQELESIPGFRWRKMKAKAHSDVPGENAFQAHDADEGKMVTWHEYYFKKNKESKELNDIRSKYDQLLSMKHDNIVQFYDYWIDDKDGRSRIVYITEQMTSGTLRAYLKKNKKSSKPIQEKVWKRWCRQILSVLCYLHEREEPVAHQNLRSSNIYVQHNSVLKLASVQLKDIKEVRTRNPNDFEVEYWPPEHDTDESHDKLKADIYAFGIILLEMKSLEQPWFGCSYAEITDRKKDGAYPSALEHPDVDPISKEFIKRCLALDPMQRPTARQLLFDPLLFFVPELKQFATHSLCHYELMDMASDALERFLIAHRNQGEGPCLHTRDCRCQSIHVGSSGGVLQPQAFEIVETDLSKYMSEVRYGLNPLLYVKRALPPQNKALPSPSMEGYHILAPPVVEVVTEVF